MLRKANDRPLPRRGPDDETPLPSGKLFAGWLACGLGGINALWTVASLLVARIEAAGEGLTPLVLVGVCVSSPLAILLGTWAGWGKGGVLIGRIGTAVNALALLAAVMILRALPSR